MSYSVILKKTNELQKQSVSNRSCTVPGVESPNEWLERSGHSFSLILAATQFLCKFIVKIIYYELICSFVFSSTVLPNNTLILRGEVTNQSFWNKRWKDIPSLLTLVFYKKGYFLWYLWADISGEEIVYMHGVSTHYWPYCYLAYATQLNSAFRALVRSD